MVGPKAIRGQLPWLQDLQLAAELTLAVNALGSVAPGLPLLQVLPTWVFTCPPLFPETQGPFFLRHFSRLQPSAACFSREAKHLEFDVNHPIL